MRLRLELFVADLDVSIAFYERVLGLRLQRREADYASLRGGPWGLRDFRIVDPDGYYWRITEPASPTG